MRAYVYRRLLLVPITVLLLSMFVFGLVRAVPGDVVASKLENSYSQDQADELLAHFGLDKPLVEQYAIWLGQIFTGDLGRSFVTSRPILDDIKVRLPVTIELLVPARLIRSQRGVRRDSAHQFSSQSMTTVADPNCFVSGNHVVCSFSRST